MLVICSEQHAKSEAQRLMKQYGTTGVSVVWCRWSFERQELQDFKLTVWGDQWGRLMDTVAEVAA